MGSIGNNRYSNNQRGLDGANQNSGNNQGTEINGVLKAAGIEPCHVI